MSRAWIAILSIFFAHSGLSAQDARAVKLSRTDSLEILTQVAWKEWGQTRDPAPLFPVDELTREAMHPPLVARIAPINPIMARGSTTCPSKMREPNKPAGWVVELSVREHRDQVFAYVSFSCGLGWENGFSTGSIYRVSLVKGRWVLGEVFGAFIT
jgi:hypothetical protein